MLIPKTLKNPWAVQVFSVPNASMAYLVPLGTGTFAKENDVEDRTSKKLIIRTKRWYTWNFCLFRIRCIILRMLRHDPVRDNSAHAEGKYNKILIWRVFIFCTFQWTWALLHAGHISTGEDNNKQRYRFRYHKKYYNRVKLVTVRYATSKLMTLWWVPQIPKSHPFIKCKIK